MNWIDTLQLTPHPEGGAFREIHRSPDSVTLADGRTRSALTHIYFHLGAGEVSRFHRVEQDEVWNLYEGRGLSLWTYNEATGHLGEIRLGREELTFCAVVPAGCWQATEPRDGGVLVGCTVAPGFEFEDFQLIQDGSPLADTLCGLGLGRLV